MNIYKIIKEEYKNILRENFSISDIPEDIKKMLDGYNLFMNFDWNSKQDEFVDKNGNYDSKGFSNWFKNHKTEEFLKDLPNLIKKVRQDIIVLHKKSLADKKLEYFEELIIPVLGNEVLIPALSKFEEDILLNSHTIEDLERGFEQAKNIFTHEGDIDQRKIEASKIFVGGELSIPAFERFVNKNPEYKPVYLDWKKMYDEYMKYLLYDLNTSQVRSIKDLKKLYNYLVKFNNTKNANI